MRATLAIKGELLEEVKELSGAKTKKRLWKKHLKSTLSEESPKN